MNVAVSWSGGKDGCLAAFRAQQEGHRLVCLLNMVARESRRCCFHGVDRRLIGAQAEAMRVPLLQKEMADDMKEYEEEFKSALRELKEHHGIEGMVFGDIFLDEHKDWVERVCRESGLVAVEPLWGRPAAEVAREFLGAGFRAVIVTCKADLMGREFAGREMDEALIGELTAKGVCPCGENGEFHTLVVDGPLFTKRIEIRKAEPVLRRGFWEHWSLEIRDWTVGSTPGSP